jgi:hypothetical protein
MGGFKEKVPNANGNDRWGEAMSAMGVWKHFRELDVHASVES